MGFDVPSLSITSPNISSIFISIFTCFWRVSYIYIKFSLTRTFALSLLVSHTAYSPTSGVSLLLDLGMYGSEGLSDSDEGLSPSNPEINLAKNHNMSILLSVILLPRLSMNHLMPRNVLIFLRLILPNHWPIRLLLLVYYQKTMMRTRSRWLIFVAKSMLDSVPTRANPLQPIQSPVLNVSLTPPK